MLRWVVAGSRKPVDIDKPSSIVFPNKLFGLSLSHWFDQNQKSIKMYEGSSSMFVPNQWEGEGLNKDEQKIANIRSVLFPLTIPALSQQFR